MTTDRQAATAAIEKKLKRAQACRKFASTLIWCGLIIIVVPTIVFAALLDMKDTAVSFVLLGMFLFILGFIIKKAASNQIKKKVSVELTRAALAEILDHLEIYDHRGSVPSAAIKVGMGYPGYDRIETQGDYIKGTFHGIAMETVDFSLSEKEIYYLPNSERPHQPHERYNTVFYGRIVLCRHRYNLSTPLLLNRFTRLYDETQTGDEDFDAVYSVRTGTSGDIARVLTPRFRESLLELAATPGGDQLAIRYDPNGALTIVLRNQDFFEISDADAKADLSAIKARFAAQMEIIGRVLDVLDL